MKKRNRLDRPSVKVAVVQMASEVFQKKRNAQKILHLLETAAKANADLVVFPEFSSPGI